MLYVNPDLLIQIEDGRYLLWDYRNHHQFLVDQRYIDRLIQWSKNQTLDPTEMDQELLDAKLLTSEVPGPNREWGWDLLSHVFHFGTQDVPITRLKNPDALSWIDEYLDYCEEIKNEQPELLVSRPGPQIVLPEPDLQRLCETTFLEVLQKRKTSRVFYGEPVTLTDLATLLFVTFGLFHGEWEDLKTANLRVTGYRKTSPSGGGLHPEEAYVVALHVEDLPIGLYHYNIVHHHLTLLRPEITEEQIINLLYHQYFAKGIAFGVFLTARFDKAWWKYKHSRAYRNVLYDIGHVSQTFQLTATALNLQTWLTGAFHDSAVNEFLKVDGQKESVLFFVGAGLGERRSFDETLLSRLNERTPIEMNNQ